MSGFEIAGVVLGSIPLIIVALEHYTEGLSTIRSMQKYEEVFGYLHASLVTISCIYRDACENLLSPLALSDDQLFQLLENRESSAWESPELNDALRNRLGSSYPSFKTSVKQLNKRINLFGRKLQLDKKFQPPWTTATGCVDAMARNKFFNDPWIRIKGGFKSKNYKELLSSIEQDINRIANLTAGAIALEPLRVERRRRANTEYLTKFRQQAEKLYDAFNTRWSSRCVCQSTHQANLRLDIQREEEPGKPSTFKLVFTFGSSHTGNSAPWKSIPVEIEAVDVTDTTKPHDSLLPSIVVHSNVKAHDHWKCLKRAPDIVDLCATLQRCPSPDCIGVMSSKLARHHIHTLHLPNVNTTDKRVTLQEIMTTQGTTIQTKEKCTLALTLASAVYHLHNTPWLEETWDLNDICILSQSLLSDQPYISREFPAIAAPPAQSQRMRIVKNGIIFALGVALLEMSYGKPLHTFVASEDLDENGKRTACTDYLIAERLVKGLRTRELFSNYADATQRCIHCNFEASVYSLDDDDFRERFYQGVIVPLRKDYEYVIGKAAA